MSNECYNPEDAWGGGPVDQSDLTTFINLSVRLPKRIISSSIDTNTDLSCLMSGNNNEMDTSYVDISFSDKEKGIYNKSLFGVSDIDISFDTSFHPIVTISFIDIKGASLFNYMEKGSIDKNDVMNSFFVSLFHFPYPQFILTVKGYFGVSVNFDLKVNDFDATFDGTTGNYIVKVSFIGDKYGALSDIPMSLISIAPYKYSNSKLNVAEDFNYKFTNENTKIPTFLEILKRYDDFINIDPKSNEKTVEIGDRKIIISDIQSLAKNINVNNKKISDYDILVNISDVCKNLIVKYNSVINSITGSGEVKYNGVYNVKKVKKSGREYYVIEVGGNDDDNLRQMYDDILSIIEFKNNISFGYTEEGGKNVIDVISENVDGFNHFLMGEKFNFKWKNFDEKYSHRNVINNIKDKALLYNSVETVTWMNGYIGNAHPLYRLISRNVQLNDTLTYTAIEENDVIYTCLNNTKDVSVTYQSKLQNMTIGTLVPIVTGQDKNNIIFLTTYANSRSGKVPYVVIPSINTDVFSETGSKTITFGNGASTHGKSSGPGHTMNLDYAKLEAMHHTIMNARKSMEEDIKDNIVYVIPCSIDFSYINTLKGKLKERKDSIQTTSSISMLNFFSIIFGFKPTISKICEIVFAHIDYFANKVMKNIYNKCLNNSEYQLRTFPSGNFFNDSNGMTLMPPFTLLGEKVMDRKNGIEKIYPGKLDHFFTEVTVNNVKKKVVKRQYYDISYIEEFYSNIAKYGDELKTIKISSNKGIKFDFKPLMPSDYLLKKNPYDYDIRNVKETSDINERILKILAYRLKNLRFLSNKTLFYNFIKDDYEYNIKPILLMKGSKTSLSNLSKSGNELSKYLIECSQNDKCLLDYSDVTNNYDCEKLENMTRCLNIKNNIHRIFVLRRKEKDDNSDSHWWSDSDVDVVISTDMTNYISMPTNPSNGLTLVDYAAHFMMNLNLDKTCPFLKKESDSSTKLVINSGGMENSVDIMTNLYNIKLFWVLKMGAYLLRNNNKDVFDKNGTAIDINTIDEVSKSYLKNEFKKWAQSKSKVKIFDDIDVYGFGYFYDLVKEGNNVRIKKSGKINVGANAGNALDKDITLLILRKNETSKGSIDVTGEGFRTNFVKPIEDTIGLVLNSGYIHNSDLMSEEVKTNLYYEMKYFGDKYMYDVYNDMFEKGKKGGYIDDNIIKVCDSLMNDISEFAYINLNTLIQLIHKSIESSPSKSVMQFLSEVAESNKLLFLTMPLNLNTENKWETIFKPYPWDSAHNSSGVTNSIIFYRTNEDSYISNVYDFSDDSLTDNDITFLKLNAFNVNFGNNNNNLFKNISMNMGGSIPTEEAIANTIRLSTGGIVGNVSTIECGAMNLYDVYKSRSYKVGIEMMGNPNVTPFMYFNLQHVPMYSGIYRIINVSHKINPNDFTTSISGVKVSKYLIPDSLEIGSVYNLIIDSFGLMSTISDEVGNAQIINSALFPYWENGFEVASYTSKVWSLEYKYENFDGKNVSDIWNMLLEKGLKFSETTDNYISPKDAFESLDSECAKVFANILLCLLEVEGETLKNKNINITSAKRDSSGKSQHNRGFAIDVYIDREFSNDNIKLSIVSLKFIHKLHMVIWEHTSDNEINMKENRTKLYNPQWIHIGVIEKNNTNYTEFNKTSESAFRDMIQYKSNVNTELEYGENNVKYKISGTKGSANSYPSRGNFLSTLLYARTCEDDNKIKEGENVNIFNNNNFLKILKSSGNYKNVKRYEQHFRLIGVSDSNYIYEG